MHSLIIAYWFCIISYRVSVLYDTSIEMDVQIMVHNLINADSRGAQSTH